MITMEKQSNRATKDKMMAEISTTLGTSDMMAALRNAATQGRPHAQDVLAVAFYHHLAGVPQDYAKAAAWWRKAALQGDSEGQGSLGYLYVFGQGVPQDFVKAAGWFRKAANQGDAFGQFGLGYLYANGKGVPKDYAQAAALYSKSADQGNTDALNNLSRLYANGQGVPQNYVAAYALLDLATSKLPANDNTVLSNGGIIAAKMTPQQIVSGQALMHKMQAEGILKALAQ